MGEPWTVNNTTAFGLGWWVGSGGGIELPVRQSPESSPQCGAGKSGGRRGKNAEEIQQEYCEGARRGDQAGVSAA